MEIITGNKLKKIFTNHWDNFLEKNESKMSSDRKEVIIENVEKMLKCRTKALGFHQYVCTGCGERLIICHSCKSHFCPSCGKKATDIWIRNAYQTLPDTRYQHIIFTLPKELQPFFWYNRELMNIVPKIAVETIQYQSNKQGFTPGIFVALHTFGRAIDRNYHIHLSTTVGGLSLDKTRYIFKAYFKSEPIKRMWKYRIITLLRNLYKEGNLILPHTIKTELDFFKLMRLLYEGKANWKSKEWNIRFEKPSKSKKINIEYLARYLKRPAIGETRILDYNGKTVTYKYLDHRTETNKIMILTVFEFIKRLITHIMDKNFKRIRYYGFLSNRTRGKLLPIVYYLLKMRIFDRKRLYTYWRHLIIRTFRYDPLQCPYCKSLMRLELIYLPPPYNKTIYFETDDYGVYLYPYYR